MKKFLIASTLLASITNTTLANIQENDDNNDYYFKIQQGAIKILNFSTETISTLTSFNFDFSQSITPHLSAGLKSVLGYTNIGEFYGVPKLTSYGIKINIIPNVSLVAYTNNNFNVFIGANLGYTGDYQKEGIIEPGIIDSLYLTSKAVLRKINLLD